MSNKANNLTAWKIYPWLVWSIGALFFFVMYTARVSPGIIQDQLMIDFGIKATQFGTLTGVFYVTYLAMQLPVGGLVDRYGAHRLLLTTTALFAIACFMFATSHSFYVLLLARLFMGFAGSFAFICTFKLAMIWFPPSMLGLLAGLTQCSGMLGAAFGEGPLSYAATTYGWRGLLTGIGVTTTCLSLAALIVMRPPPKNKLSPVGSWSDLWLGLGHVLSNPQSWLNALFAGLIFMPTLAFGEAWGAPYLIQAKGFSLHQAGMAESFLFAGWVIGGVLVGSLSDWMQKRKPVFFGSAFISAGLFALLIEIPDLTYTASCIILFGYGLVNTGLIASYALSGEINSMKVSGVSVSFCNLVSVLIGAIFVPMIGWMFDQYDPVVVNGVFVYPKVAYDQVFIVFPIILVIAGIVAYFIQETHCRNIEDQPK